MDKFVEENEVFEKYSIIKREQYADFLTNFLNQQAENGYVLNLNAEWGAGKTTFLKCWYNKLKANHPVVYFDAWKTDFTHDAMTALMDSFHAQLANPISGNKALFRDFYEKGMHFIKVAVPSLAVGYLKHKSGMQDDESLLQDITDTFGINVTEDSCSDALKETLKAALEQRKKVEGIHEFKTALENIADEYIKVSNKHIPIYIFIDELDRCRPNYAIEVIENVKHFFNTKNFVFVIATDTKQLQHSIKAIYGNNFDASIYLSRFFNQTVSLPQPKTNDYLNSIFPEIHLTPHNKQEYSIDKEYITNIISGIFIYHKINSLREISKITKHVLMLQYVSNKEVNILTLFILIILKKYHNDAYMKFINSQFNPYKNFDNNQYVDLSNSTIIPNFIEPSLEKIINSTSANFIKFNDVLSTCLNFAMNSYDRESHYSKLHNTKQNYLIHTNEHYACLFSHIVFNQGYDKANFIDYQNLIDISYIEN
ncbi:KAP family P-loop NTPase fold protein [Photobacterium leiognathi]|uniref:KAP family P-loop NTPase fold protein n=1 Tax=Photobacterium leiognathi TaxID=553611 RepID=UPI0027388A07|nr:P-loop NTPase fold protein [Photobacterium leiognathi]